MWILIVVIYMNGGVGMTSIEMQSRQSCINAVAFAKTRRTTEDAYCVQK